MQFRTDTLDNNIIVDGNKLDNVEEFCYLGHTIFNHKNNDFVDLRIARATAKFNELNNVLKDKEINICVRRKLLESCVRPRLTYATQCWWPNEKQLKNLNLAGIPL